MHSVDWTENRRRRERAASLSLADIKVVCLIQNPPIDSPGIAERAEYHVQSHPQTFPRGLAPDYRAVGTMLGRRGKTLFAPQASLPPGRHVQKATAVFGRAGGRLVVPNTGKHPMGRGGEGGISTHIKAGWEKRAVCSRNVASQ